MAAAGDLPAQLRRAGGGSVAVTPLPAGASSQFGVHASAATLRMLGVAPGAAVIAIQTGEGEALAPCAWLCTIQLLHRGDAADLAFSGSPATCPHARIARGMRLPPEVAEQLAVIHAVDSSHASSPSERAGGEYCLVGRVRLLRVPPIAVRSAVSVLLAYEPHIASADSPADLQPSPHAALLSTPLGRQQACKHISMLLEDAFVAPDALLVLDLLGRELRLVVRTIIPTGTSVARVAAGTRVTMLVEGDPGPGDGSRAGVGKTVAPSPPVSPWKAAPTSPANTLSHAAPLSRCGLPFGQDAKADANVPPSSPSAGGPDEAGVAVMATVLATPGPATSPSAQQPASISAGHVPGPATADSMLAGLDMPLELLREMMLTPFRHAHLVAALRLEPPKGGFAHR
jgi:hypothetical protein